MTTANAHENTEDARMTEGPSTPGPYARSARFWRAAGWFGVLPVVGKDERLPGGFTGHAGVWPSGDQIADWCARRGNDNIVIRLPRNVIGIDVDAYDGRAGLDTINNFELHYGELPQTWVSTSRDDGSGIRLYQVPENISWVSDLGPKSDVQIIRHDHRYFVAWPSIHPLTNRQYQIRMPVGLSTENPPRPEQLTQLPDNWIKALTKIQPTITDLNSGLSDPNAVSAVDPSLMLFVGAPPGEQDQRLFEYVCSMRARKFRMEEAVLFAIAAVSQMEHSRPEEPWTAELAQQKVVRIWQTIREGTSAEQALTDKQRAWARATQELIVGSTTVQEPAQAPASTPTQAPTSGSTAMPVEVSDTPLPPDPGDWVRPELRDPPENASDTGNADRFARLFAGKQLRYVPELDQWHEWNGQRWTVDVQGRAFHLTRAVIADIYDDATRLTTQDDDSGARWGVWALQSESEVRRKAIVSIAEKIPAFIIHANELDTEAHLIACENGVIELSDNGWSMHTGRPEDRLSMNTNFVFDTDARSDDWDSFISYVQPNVSVRAHLQALDGYTLYGANPLRYWIILRGDTTTGKTTHIESIGKTLGDYACAANISIFRGNYDERPRADLVTVLPKRRVYMSEVEAGTELHADQVKRITGGDQVSARLPFSRHFVTRVPAFTPITAMNGLPSIADADGALRHRLHAVPFNMRTDADSSGEMLRITNLLKAPLSDNLKSAIFAWLLEGWNMHCKGVLDTPVQELDVFNMEVHAGIMPLSSFIDSYCEIDAEYADISERLFLAYQCWESSEATHRKDKLTSTKFGRLLTAAGFGSQKRVWTLDLDGNRKQKTVWYGIRVRDEHSEKVRAQRWQSQ